MSDFVARRVTAIIADRHNLRPDQLTPACSLEELGIDSLDGLDLIFRFEEEFGVSFPPGDLPDVATVGDLVAAVTDLLPTPATTGV